MAGYAKVSMQFAYVPAVGSGVPDMIVTSHCSFDDIVTPTDGDIDALMALYSTWWSAGAGGQPAGRTLYSSTIVLDRITGQAFTPSPAPPRVLTVGVGGNRALPIGQLPPQVAVGWSLVTNLATRSGHGRMYMPACDSGVVSGNGLMTPAYHDEHRDSANGFLAGLVADADWSLVVLSRVLGTTNAVTDVKVGRRVDTQRRRLPREQEYLS